MMINVHTSNANNFDVERSCTPFSMKQLYANNRNSMVSQMMNYELPAIYNFCIHSLINDTCSLVAVATALQHQLMLEPHCPVKSLVHCFLSVYN